MAVRHALASGLPPCLHRQMYPYTDPLVSPEHLEAIARANIIKDRCQIYSIKIPKEACIGHYGDYVVITSLDPLNEAVQKVALYSLRHRTMLWTKEMAPDRSLTDPTRCQVSDHGMVLIANRDLMSGSDIDDVQDIDSSTISIMLDGRQIGSLPNYLWMSVIPKGGYILTKRIDKKSRLAVLEIWDPSLREPCFQKQLALQGLPYDGFLIHSDDFMVHLSENGDGTVRIDAVDLRMIDAVDSQPDAIIRQDMTLTGKSDLSSACIVDQSLIVSCHDSEEERSTVYIYDLVQKKLTDSIDIETADAVEAMTANRHFLVWRANETIKYLKFSDKEVKIIATSRIGVEDDEFCSLQLSGNILSLIYALNHSFLNKKIIDLSVGKCLSSTNYDNQGGPCSLSNHRLIIVYNDEFSLEYDQLYIEDYATSAVESSNTGEIILRAQRTPRLDLMGNPLRQRSCRSI